MSHGRRECAFDKDLAPASTAAARQNGRKPASYLTQSRLSTILERQADKADRRMLLHDMHEEAGASQPEKLNVLPWPCHCVGKRQPRGVLAGLPTTYCFGEKSTMHLPDVAQAPRSCSAPRWHILSPFKSYSQVCSVGAADCHQVHKRHGCSPHYSSEAARSMHRISIWHSGLLHAAGGLCTPVR